MDANSFKTSSILDKACNENNIDEIENQEMTSHSDVEEYSQESENNLEISDFDNLSRQKQNKAQQPSESSPKKSSEEKKDSLTLFSEYLKGDDEFDFEVISKCSAKEISAYLGILLEYFFKNFNEIDFCKVEVCLYIIYRKSRYTVQGKAAFLAASDEFFNREFRKISRNSNWSEVVMFGAFLCELLPYHKPGNFEITKQLNIWIMELVNCSAGGNENSLIAFMLILKRLSKIFNPLNGSYGQLLKVLKILVKDGDSVSKKSEITNYLDQNGYLNLEDYESLEAVKYKNETENSIKCKEFEDFLNLADENALFNVAMFTDILDNEIEYFARKFVEIGIKEPQKMKYLAYIAYRFQQIVGHIRRIGENIVKNLDDEIEVMRKNEGKGSIQIINFAKFIGECYMYETDMIPTKTITNWLSLLTDLGETVPIVTTLKLCGGIYKASDLENFKKFFEPLGAIGTVVKEEMKRVREQFDADEMETYIKYQKSRRFQPAEEAKMIVSFKYFLAELSNDKNVKFDYLSLYKFRYHDSINATKIIMQEIARPTANVIKIAEFFKSFFEFSVKLGKFVTELKETFLNKIAEIPVDRPEEMIRVGMLIGELRNFAVIEKYPQEKWLEMIESLKPAKNCKILEIQLDVLKVMMYNLYIHEEGKYMKYIKDLKAINTADPKYSPKIKSKVLQIMQNLIHKKFDKSAKIIFIKMKSGSKFDEIPKDILEISPTEFDLHDFVKFYFLTASKNPFFIDNYLKSKKFLLTGQQGQKFGIILNKLIFDRFKEITSPQYFDEHEAVPTLQFILANNSRSIYRENSVPRFLQNILEFEDFETHKECFRILAKMLKKSKLNEFPRADSRAIFCLLRKIQAKFIKIEDIEAEDQDEVEIWHIVDYQGFTNDPSLLTIKSIEPSQLAWSFTKNYQENHKKVLKIMENSKNSVQNVDKLAQNFKDSSRNFHKIQQPGCNPQNFVKTRDDQNDPNLTENEQNLTQKNKISTRDDQNLAHNQQKSTKTDQRSHFKQRYQNKKGQKPEIEWSVTRDDLKDRSDLQNVDLPNIKKRFDHNSPLYQGSSQSGHGSGTNNRRTRNKN